MTGTLTIDAASANLIIKQGTTAVGTSAATSKLTVAGTIEMTAGSGGGIKYPDGTSEFSGLRTKGATFIYPFMTSEAGIQIPTNATISSLEVMVEGAASSSLTGRLLNNGATVGTVTLSGTGQNNYIWGGSSGALANTSYTANQNLVFQTITVTGTVYTATIQFDFKQRP